MFNIIRHEYAQVHVRISFDKTPSFRFEFGFLNGAYTNLQLKNILR